MREVTFTLEYESEVDPVMDILIESPDVAAYSIDSCASRDRFWRVERFTGPTDALERVERARLDDEQRERMTKSHCGASRHHELLESTPNSRVFYSYIHDLHRCDSVVGNSARYLDLGMVFQTSRSGSMHEWRLLVRSKENVDTFFDTVEDNLQEGVALHFDRLCEVESWDIDSLSMVSLPEDQRDVLRLAVERGYYETPRQVTIDELAAELDVPSSTLSYRLRRAEAQMAEGFVESYAR
ncbi:helix-turn-helix domain-containing protein [Haloarchaeobius sp. HRN-SO-5]|uniref:helix-turn-helix domain-containing protein n=1 Tax=Haloarchaeobius sp. HRN-SO-5 TaxID=3446118 RepID=UPI003EBFC9BD